MKGEKRTPKTDTELGSAGEARGKNPHAQQEQYSAVPGTPM